MSEPKQELLRRSQVFEWLEEKEFSRRQTRKLMSAGVIIGKSFLEWFQVKDEGGRMKEEGGKKGKNGAVKRHGRQSGDPEKRYRKSQIKEALGL